MSYLIIDNSGIEIHDGFVTVPLLNMRLVCELLHKLSRRYPDGALSGLLKVYKGGAGHIDIDHILVNSNDKFARRIVSGLQSTVLRLKTARIKNEPARTYPEDRVHLELNKLVHAAEQRGMQVFLDGEKKSHKLEGENPESILTAVAKEVRRGKIRALCSGAQIVKTPGPQGDLFPEIIVNVMFYVIHEQIKEISYTGPLEESWKAKALACEIEVDYEQDSSNEKRVMAIGAPIFHDL